MHQSDQSIEKSALKFTNHDPLYRGFNYVMHYFSYSDIRGIKLLIGSKFQHKPHYDHTVQANGLMGPLLISKLTQFSICLTTLFTILGTLKTMWEI